MATKNGMKSTVDKKCQMIAYTPGAQNFAPIALSRTFSEINMLLCFTYTEIKIAVKNDGKTTFSKKCQMILHIPWGQNILLKLFYLTLFPR